MFAEKYAPKSFDEMVGRSEIVDPIKKQIEERHEINHLLLYGPSGIGKTTLAFCIRNAMYGKNPQHLFFELNASNENGIDTVREKISNWAKLALPTINGKRVHRIIFLDEADGLTPQAQRTLRRTMEDHAATTRFIISCNYYDKMIDALKSRCQCIPFNPLPYELVVKYLAWILKQESLPVDKTQVQMIAKISNGDLRKALHMLDQHVNGKTFRDVAGGNLLKLKFDEIRKLSYEQDVKYLFSQIDQELGKLLDSGVDIRKSILILSEYEYRASMATIGAIHFQSCWLKVKSELAKAKE